MASCASSVPSQKLPDQRSKSCETACSSNSSCFFQKRKPANPLATPLRGALVKNSIRQRVLSAKVLKLKSVQNQLSDANFHLAEVMRENQALKTLQKRQDRALTKYEGTNAELPKLIHSHEEELRILSEKNKTFKRTVRELNEQLKHRNDELLYVQEQLKHYEKLDKDKRLLEREKLMEELDDHKSQLKKAQDEIVVLNRRLALETKASKQRLNLEMNKHRQCQKELQQALVDVAKLTQMLDKEGQNEKKRLQNLHRLASTVTFTTTTTETSDVKLEPLGSRNDSKTTISVLKCPSENIKARLSSSSTSRKTSNESIEVDNNSEDTTEHKPLIRSNSAIKLDKLELNLESTMKKSEVNKSDDGIGKRIGNYCLRAIDTVKNYSNVIENHKENLEYARADTDKLRESFEEAESMELKLKQTHLLSFDTNLTDDNLDFVNEILTEEFEFKKKYKEYNNETARKEPSVGLADKKKLLATLRAIDNGDSVDSFEEQQQNDLFQQLFAD